jgi:hypothetical protein
MQKLIYWIFQKPLISASMKNLPEKPSKLDAGWFIWNELEKS